MSDEVLTINALVENLKKLESKPELKMYAGMFISDTDLTFEDREIDHLLSDIGVQADKILITVNSQPNAAALGMLLDAGYRVTEGEKDSFGWLTGVIHTKVGKIVFG